MKPLLRSTTASSAPVAATITVNAMIELYPSDPIGTTATFQLTVGNSTQGSS